MRFNEVMHEKLRTEFHNEAYSWTFNSCLVLFLFCVLETQ